MKKYYPILTACPLFSGISEADLQALLGCLCARVLSFGKGQTVFAEGDPTTQVGILLSGSAHLMIEDYFGNRSIVTGIEVGQLFGESFSFAGLSAYPVSIVADQPCQVMLLNSYSIANRCCNGCAFHNQLVYNLLKVVSEKNLLLHQKLDLLSQRTTREKLMSYLLSQAKHHGSNRFRIPYDRQALADYLGVDRSALSAEISKMRKLQLIDCEKSQFTVLSAGKNPESSMQKP